MESSCAFKSSPLVLSPLQFDAKDQSSSSSNKKQTSQAKKPRDKPKRPLSAYNLFFRHEREHILRTTSQPTYKPRRSHGKIGFAALARQVAEKWKSLDDKTRSVFEAKAALEKERYDREIDEWNRARIAKMSSYVPPTPKFISNLGGGSSNYHHPHLHHHHHPHHPPPSMMSKLDTQKALPMMQPSLTSLTFDSHRIKVYEQAQAAAAAAAVPPPSQCDEQQGGSNCSSGNNTPLLRAAVNICKEPEPSPVLSNNLDCTPIALDSDEQSQGSNGSLGDLAAIFDEECFDIIRTLKSCP